MNQFLKKARSWLYAVRWYQWGKGSLVLLALFGRPVNTIADLQKIVLALVLVTTVSGAIYINNDIADIERDRNHPTKKGRPFASGALSKNEGYWGLGILLSIVLLLLYFVNNLVVTLLVLFMIFGNVLYTKKIKQLPYIELFYYGFLATSRYWIGAATLENPHFILQTVIFLSSGVHALTLLRFMEKNHYGDKGRALLSLYSLTWLKRITSFFGAVLVIALITMSVNISAWLLVPSVLFGVGIWRFTWFGLQKVENPEKTDDVDKIIWNDRWMKILMFPYIACLLWVVVTSFL